VKGQFARWQHHLTASRSLSPTKVSRALPARSESSAVAQDLSVGCRARPVPLKALPHTNIQASAASSSSSASSHPASEPVYPTPDVAPSPRVAPLTQRFEFIRVNDYISANVISFYNTIADFILRLRDYFFVYVLILLPTVRVCDTLSSSSSLLNGMFD